MSDIVAVVGSGSAADAVRSALADADAVVENADVSEAADADLAVVVGLAGSEGFAAANRTVGGPWLAVEVGGLGGHALADVDASVSCFWPDDGCFACLRSRVAANDPEVADAPSADRSTARFAGALAGRLAVRALAGDSFGGRVVEAPHTQRSFLPVPTCPVCGDTQSQEFDWSGESRSVDAAADAAARAVDDRVGVVAAVGERESYPAPYYLAQVSDTSAFSDATAARQAAGVATDWNEAYVKAVGEALERYAAGVYRASAFETAMPTHPDAVSPTEFVLPDGAPTPDPDDALQWVRGEHLGAGDDALLPAEFVQFPPHAERYRDSITTGLGLGNTAEEAVLSGLYEVIERDAAMLAWYSSYDPLGLAVEDEAYAELAKRARSEGLDATAFLLTQDVDVPVVGVAVTREEWPRFALGSSASLDADAAARGALEEAVQNWMELRAMGRETAAQQEGAIGAYADYPGRVRDFVTPDTTVPTDSVGPDEVPENELNAVVSRLADADLAAYAARLTTRDVDALGFEAARVLVPTAQPLFVGDAYFGERAESVPENLGFEPDLEKAYHPFP
ncbi:YcaO-like family protein [Salarchaeum sp. JOR-1]|uniref:YcaO-like family protein n=1 Tax=Salarchaeum sp. JOR-1 TaxID=2599399 RepID=UPI00119890CF|nr:YcaO-like family protein [Salarchaeum sp. JOR-1]QDX41682.1 bacteriocin biosynthesis protein SagD [Salarchaeum sp. JOR-1]